MKNKKSLFIGFLLGMLLMILVNSIFSINNISNLILMRNNKEIMEQYEDKTNMLTLFLNKFYLEDLEVDKLLEGGYKGFVQAVGDPYTEYYDEEEFKKLFEDLEGRYAGIGALVSVDPKDNLPIIVMPFEGSPSIEAGLQPLDKIIKVNDEDITGVSLDEVVKKMKGEEGTEVKITILRKNAEEQKVFDVVLIRRIINVPTVGHRMLADDIGYLQIIGFDAVTYDQFMEALNDLETQNEKGLIIDLRNNPGGSLEIVSKIADELLPKGVIVYTEDKNGKKEYINSDDEKQFNKPIVILINENSASASEVLSGAIKDYKAGKLVGTTSFGKGLVQQIRPLPDGSAMKITIAKYYTPSGNYIHGKGIEPDYKVELPEELKYKAGLKEEEDVQLLKAIEVIKEDINGMIK